MTDRFSTAMKGDWVETFTGRKFYPLSPRIEDICIEDIAHALAYKCRYAGHCVDFYSVAEHSILLADAIRIIVANKPFTLFQKLMLELWALLHDAAEAYTADVPRPLKRYLPEFQRIEDNVMSKIVQKFNLHPSIQPAIISQCDHAILTDEKEQAMQSKLVWSDAPYPALNVEIKFIHPAYIEIKFLERYKKLTSLISQLENLKGDK